MPGIKLKSKPVASDATSVKSPTNPLAVRDAHAKKISKMDDKQLMDDAVDQSMKGNSSRKYQDTDSLASRNIKRRGGYKMGTKGIKVKPKSA